MQLPILLSSVSFIFLIIAVIGTNIFYKKIEKKSYSVFSFFPHELIVTESRKFNTFGFIALLNSIILNFWSVSYTFVFDKYFNNANGWAIFVLISFILSSLAFIYLLFIDPRYNRKHIFGSDILFTFVLLMSLAIIFFEGRILQNAVDTKKVVLFAVAILLAIFNILLFFNPKLKNWAEMKRIQNDDGTITLSRGKYFVLAYTEWAFYLSLVLSIISLEIFLI